MKFLKMKFTLILFVIFILSINSSVYAAAPNIINVKITPNNNVIKIRAIRKSGAKTCNVTCNMTIRNAKGKITGKKTKNFSQSLAPVYREWKQPINKKTVEEKITTKITVTDGKTAVYKTLYDYRNNFVGGKYGAIKPLDGQRHHCFARALYKKAKIETYGYRYAYDRSKRKNIKTISAWYGPSILMTKDDHAKTLSYKNTKAGKVHQAKQLKLIKQKKYLEAMEKDIKDVRKNFDKKYDKAINQMYIYATRTLGWYK